METKDNTLSIIALVALVAVVGMVVAFAVSSKGSTAAQTATPVYAAATPTTPAEIANAAGMMKSMTECITDKCQTECGSDGSRDPAGGCQSCWNSMYMTCR